jgi:hypothetical protein
MAKAECLEDPGTNQRPAAASQARPRRAVGPTLLQKLESARSMAEMQLH